MRRKKKESVDVSEPFTRLLLIYYSRWLILSQCECACLNFCWEQVSSKHRECFSALLQRDSPQLLTDCTRQMFLGIAVRETCYHQANVTEHKTVHMSNNLCHKSFIQWVQQLQDLRPLEVEYELIFCVCCFSQSLNVKWLKSVCSDINGRKITKNGQQTLVAKEVPENE